jgi:hypothetical protein
MAKIGTMPTNNEGAVPVSGVPHFGNKLIQAPKPRNNMLNDRVAPMKRTLVGVTPLKASKPNNVGNF